jgi:uncharacterized membrane protein
MDTGLLVILLVVLLVRWIYLREKFQEIEQKFEELQAAVRRVEWNAQVRPAPAHAPAQAAAPAEQPAPHSAPQPAHQARPFVDPPVERVAPITLVTPSVPEPPLETPEPAREPRAAEPAAAGRPASRPTVDWELVVGGNWMLKIGAFVMVMGLGYLLKYAWGSIGPGGRIALSYAASFAMLGGGVWSETRERFRTFGYGLIGAGWAAVYLTTYAMYGIPEAKILDSAIAATVLLLVVAAGMIAHSLKYRSQTVTALAAFIAFFTLAISDVTTFSVVALIPLAVALLYIAYRNQWSRFALFGLIATYITCGMHKDTGAPLWQTQSLFLAYWLLFEAFDLLRGNVWLLPLNALGFLALSWGKWQHAAPDQIWQLAAGASALYLVSTILRAPSDRWRPAVTLHAALATTAILLKLHDQWVPLALLIEAELYYLAGVRWNSRWLRGMAALVFTLEVGHLMIGEAGHIPPHTWEPVAVATLVVFYLNRALRAGDVIYGYAAAGLAVVVSGFEATAETCGRVWFVMSLAPFGFGWWRRQIDFRIQGYGLAAIGAIATAMFAPHPPISLAIGAAVAYAFVQCTLWSGQDRFVDEERDALRIAASLATALGLSALVWKMVPGEYLGIGWLALAVVLFETGLLDLPREFRWQAYIVALAGATRVVGFDLESKLALVSAGLTYLLAYRVRKEEQGRVTDVLAFPGTLFLMAGLLALLPAAAVTPAWALVALALAEFGRGSLSVQALIVSASVFIRCVAVDFDSPQIMLSVAPAIACYCAALLRRERGSFARLCYSLMAVGLTAALIYQEVSGSMRTIAWGLEGVALLGAGFPLGDRVLRLSGLAMLAGCIGKLFFWDLRNLDTLPRIFSFIVLGALLVGVSWVYTRFRESVQRYL